MRRLCRRGNSLHQLATVDAMKVSGFSIIRNGMRFGYPFVESIRSILPLVDEFVLAVGKSDDGTLQRARSLSEEIPKLRIIETEWDENLLHGGLVMSQQTNLALDECVGDWCFYLQGDEVIHEQDHDSIAEAMRRYLPQRRVEGLSFRYRHFYGSYGLVNPLPYRRQVRIVRRGVGVRSVGDACGFRVDGRKLRTKSTDALVYHYGWVRSPAAQQEKTNNFIRLYHGETIKPQPVATSDDPSETAFQYKAGACLPFEGTHPEVLREVVAAQDWPEPEYRYVPWWRNTRWWDGMLQKNFKTIYRIFDPNQPSFRRRRSVQDSKKAA
jgi:hypothetical protein